MTDRAEVYRGLRDRALHSTPADLGLNAEGALSDAFGVVMDWSLSQGVATVVALETGDASIYLSSGGGMIGGGAHDSVKAAARSFVAIAAQHATELSATDVFPIPRDGFTRFYLLTRGGVVDAEAPTQELGQGIHPLSPLFHAGQEVISTLRVATTKG